MPSPPSHPALFQPPDDKRAGKGGDASPDLVALLTALSEALARLAAGQLAGSPLPPLADAVHPLDAQDSARGSTSRSRARGSAGKTATLLTLEEVYAELGGIARSTFYDWRAKGKAPRCIKLPNGDLRVRRTELDRWLTERVDAA